MGLPLVAELLADQLRLVTARLCRMLDEKVGAYLVAERRCRH